MQQFIHIREKLQVARIHFLVQMQAVVVSACVCVALLAHHGYSALQCGNKYALPNQSLSFG